MINAYDESYLNDAMMCLGEAMDYASNECKIDMDVFLEMFIISGYSEQFANGISKVVSGMSGTELVMNVLLKNNIEIDFPSPKIEYYYTKAYWCGWILAYYQWISRRSFKDIKKYISMDEINRLYFPLHEASKEKFIEVVNNIIKRKTTQTRLQMQRKISGYSQRELALKVGVNLRTLQQYEIRAKDINKAAGITLYALSKALGCRIEDLLEYDNNVDKI